MQKMTPIRIDIVSDVVCPWCIIGFRQLEQAVERSGLGVVVHWHPFELNPTMGAEGEDLREHVAWKYGTTREGSDKARGRLKALGEDLGIDFLFGEDTRIRNTFRSHQLIRWANEQGQGHQMKMALFEAYFEKGLDVHDPQILADAAESIGLDRTEALAVAEDGRYADAVREEERFWTGQGIQGVPAMVFQRKYLVSGAQGVDNYLQILDAMAKESEAAE